MLFHSLLSLFRGLWKRLNLCLSDFSVNLIQSVSSTFYLSRRVIFENIWDFTAEWLKNKLINIKVIIRQQLALCLQLQSSFYCALQQDIEQTVQSLWKPSVNCSSSPLPAGRPAVWDDLRSLLPFDQHKRKENYSVKALLVGEQWLGLNHCWDWQINLCLHGR